MDLIGTKLLVAFLFGLIRFLFGILPIKLCAWFKIKPTNSDQTDDTPKQDILEYGIAVVQSFGGGVLFATCFLHMMPQVYYSVEELKEYGVLAADYPYSQLILSLGFFTIYFIEELSQWLISRTPKEPYKESNKQLELSKIVIENKITPQISKFLNGRAFEIKKCITDCAEEKPEKEEKYFEDNNSATVIVDCVDQEVQTDAVDNLNVLDNMEANLDLDVDVNAQIEDFIQDDLKTQQQMLRCFLMVLALSLHAFFEGLAIGLQRSVTSIWYLFIAVSIHSATILFVIGSEVVLSGATPTRTMIHMSMLSVTSPVGVLLGLFITLTTNLHTSAKSFAIVLLEGLSAGTILYITFFETLSREKQRRKSRFIRAIVIGAGFTLMAVLQAFKLGM